MNTEIRDRHRPSRWRYSLRTLLFLTSIVALCSMLIGISVVLAIVTVPFLIVAFTRTLRISGTAADDLQAKTHRPSLIATFCRSLVLIFSLLAVTIATAAFASLAAALIVVNIIVRICRPMVAKLQPILRQAWRITVAAARRVVSIATYSNLGRALDWSSTYAMLGTRYLIAATSVLHRRYWSLGATGSASASIRITNQPTSAR